MTEVDLELVVAKGLVRVRHFSDTKWGGSCAWCFPLPERAGSKEPVSSSDTPP